MVLKELNEVLRFKNASDLAMAKPEKTADFSRLHSKRVSMGLTVRRKTAKNLSVRRKNERILAVSRKKN